MSVDRSHRRRSVLAAAAAPLGTVAELVLAGRYPENRPHDTGTTAPPAPTPVPDASPLALPLPPGDHLLALPRPLASVIVERRSGPLSPEPVDAATLAALLAAATAGARPELVPDASFAPELYPVVLSVTGVPAGAHRYLPADHALAPIRAVDLATFRATFVNRALLQKEQGAGAAVLFLVVPLGRWLARAGDRGYRGAAFAAGWLTDRLYLAAETLGLTYTGTGGFAPVVVDELLGLDGGGLERTALFAFALGGPRRQRPVPSQGARS